MIAASQAVETFEFTLTIAGIWLFILVAVGLTVWLTPIIARFFRRLNDD